MWPFWLISYYITNVPTTQSLYPFFEKISETNINPSISVFGEKAFLLENLEIQTRLGQVKLPEDIFPPDLKSQDVGI